MASRWRIILFVCVILLIVAWWLKPQAILPNLVKSIISKKNDPFSLAPSLIVKAFPNTQPSLTPAMQNRIDRAMQENDICKLMEALQATGLDSTHDSQILEKYVYDQPDALELAQAIRAGDFKKNGSSF